MHTESYFCAYHSVAYFVFRKDCHGSVEPILEVGGIDEGKDLIQWLNKNRFVDSMITSASNDWH